VTVDELKKERLEWLKHEYERASVRYNELYASIWTIFNYMAIVAGAIFSLSSDQLPLDIRIIAAMVPLGIWYLGAYKPLNRYGENVIESLTRIESCVGDLIFVNPDPDAHGGMPACKPSHYTSFAQFRKKNKALRVSTIATWFAWGILIVVAVLIFLRAAGHPLPSILVAR
jgi:hypothetical protein